MIIGLTGLKGHGKDTVGALLRDRHGFRLRAFADPLKAIARELYDLSAEQLHGPLEVKEAIDPRWGMSPREILQRLGTEVGRSVHPETWTRALERYLEASPGHWAITDCRFPNEAACIRRLGGTVILVERPGFGTGLNEEHASEQAVRDIAPDLVVVNEGPLADLAALVDEAVTVLRACRPRGRR